MLTNLDEAIECFHETDLEFGPGLTNHGPMAAQALESLGHPALIPAFVDVYRPRLRPFSPGSRIAVAQRTRAIGDRARRADWVATFEAEIAESGWQVVLGASLPMLLPGGFAAAGHGALRTYHAVQALSDNDSFLRRRELAFGLGHWASRFQLLPGDPGARAKTGNGPRRALRGLSGVAADRRRLGLMSEAVLVLEGDAGFAAKLAAVDLDMMPPEAFLAELVNEAARLYLEHPESRVVYSHAITVPMALVGLMPFLSDEGRRMAAGSALKAVAALHGVYGSGVDPVPADRAADPEVEALANDVGELRYRAACSGEEHAIKVTDACLRAHALNPDPVLMQAAADAALRSETMHGGRGA